MREITNKSLTGVEPRTLELSSDLSKEVRESIADVTRLVVEDISHQTSFWREKDRVLQNRDLYRFFSTTRLPLLAKARSRNNPHGCRKSAKLHFCHSGSDQRVAIVGSGPAGLTCDWDLAKIDYKPALCE